jgi:type II secretory pathway pseudopilin PulG
MMKKKQLKGIIAAAMMISIISTYALAGDQQSAQAAIAAAETAQKNAASVDGEWRDTGKMIKQAQAAMKKGNFDEAVKLANKAERQGKYGYEQAVSQKDLKMPSYLKY